MRTSLSKVLGILLAVANIATACDLHRHQYREVPAATWRGPHSRDQAVSNTVRRRADDEDRDWTYSGASSWGSIKPEYAICGNGTQQSPINILSSYGLAATHQPFFVDYDRVIRGDLSNWGFGPEYVLRPDSEVTLSPTLRFDNRTVYLVSWHMHFPSEHPLDGRYNKGELHLVHVDANGVPAAVVGILIDVGDPSRYFSKLPRLPTPEDDVVIHSVALNMYQAIEEAGGLKKYVTYQGSLTTPPCDEGLRWFVSKDILKVSQRQMDALLESSGGLTSARPLQPVIDQRVNL